MAGADNVDLARSLVELWNAGDIDGVVDLYTETGIGGHLPFVILLTLRGGKIAVLEWFTDHDEAVAAARAT